MAQKIVRRIRLAHCKQGPERCDRCRELDGEQLCLLEIHPPDAGLMQRRLIEVEVDGKLVWRAFEVLRVFEDEDEARVWGLEEGVTDLGL